jgi:cytoskeletal protein RodZ
MAIKNRLVKLITISAGACLILGSLAGCKPAEEPEATAAASEAQEESETETEAPQASVATSESETSEATESSDDFVIEPEYIYIVPVKATVESKIANLDTAVYISEYRALPLPDI